jgi:hypothetical protein
MMEILIGKIQRRGYGAPKMLKNTELTHYKTTRSRMENYARVNRSMLNSWAYGMKEHSYFVFET